MSNNLASIRLALLLLLFVSAAALSAKSAQVEMRVQADIHSSTHMQWKKITTEDDLYQKAKQRLKMQSDWVLLPYGLYVELQTNDADKMVSLHIDDLVSSDKKRVITTEQFYISINGDELQSAVVDLPLLQPKDKGKMQQHALLFVLKVKPSNYAGNYAAKFKFITKTLP